MDKPTLSIAVLSGKGGVGKSNLALNLGLALHDMGQKILLMDCDIGLANMDILLGISTDKFLQDIFLSNTKVEDILVPLNQPGEPAFDLIPSASGISGMADLDAESRHIICERINPVAANYTTLILDICAGITPTALNFSGRTDIRLVIVTPEPTSLTDSYALIKVMATTQGIHSFQIIVNQAESEQEAKETYSRLSLVCDKFLGFKPDFLGYIRHDTAVPASVIQQVPFLRNAPKSHAAQDCRTLATRLRERCASLAKATDAPALRENE